MFANKDFFADFVKPRLKELDDIAAKYGRKRVTIDRVHILVGEILGYVCPSSMKSLYEMDEIQDISIDISGIQYMGVWCPKNSKFIDKQKEIIVKINKLGLPAKLQATQKKLGGKHRTTKKAQS